jgi:ribosomal protein S18 acetylase RimI-like enzyme
MIRPTEPDDTTALVELARATGVFKASEVTALREVLDDYHARERALGHRAVVLELDDKPAGFTYYAPSDMADRAWYLWWIAVDPGMQAKGLGSVLLRHAEAEIREAGARLVLIETSSLPRYEPTRRFYLRHGYEVYGVLPDFYADGDDMVVFSKRFLPRDSAPPQEPLP